MSETPELDVVKKENWGSKMGVVLAVAGSAVGLGNFLRFPGQAVNNGGGAFMLPYLISFLILGIPICWYEWTMGRLGGRYGQNNGPGIMFALWRRMPSKVIGAVTILVPVVVYMYYIVVEAWCLDYAVAFFQGGIAEQFAEFGRGAESAGDVIAKSGEYFGGVVGAGEHGAALGGRLIWMVPICFVVNFIIIYRGVTKGIETFCKFAMPLLIGCACIILVRALTLPDVVMTNTDGSETVRSVSGGLGFMWNPQWEKLRDPSVWLAASGQIFFSLSVGFGLILCYSSYLRKDDDVVLTSLTASSTNEFCEVILGGMIIIPCAFLFLGAENAKGGTFSLGFVTMPAIMHFMPGGQFFGGMWFGLLFLAAVTSSLSMLQPAIAFIEDGFGLGRAASVAVLVVVTFLGMAPVFYFSGGLVALDHTDFWCNFLMIVAALGQVLIFGWIIGAGRGVREANRGADFSLPRFMPFVIRYITPTFLIIVLVMWFVEKSPDYLRGMIPQMAGAAAERGVYEEAIRAHFADTLDEEAMDARVEELLGESGLPETLPEIVLSPSNRARSASEGLFDRSLQEKAKEARQTAEANAPIAACVFLGVVLILVLLIILTHIACKGRIGRSLEVVRQRDGELELI